MYIYMRVVGLNYSGVPPVAVDRIIYVLARARVVICCTRRSRGAPQEKPDDDWCQEKEGRKKSVFSCICVLLVAATCSVQAAASESLVELSYDLPKIASLMLAAHSRSDLAQHVAFVRRSSRV